jgi:hypothetical protein
MFSFENCPIQFRAGDALGSIHAAALHDRWGAADLVSEGVSRAEQARSNRRLTEGRVGIGESLHGHRHTAPIRALGGPREAGGEQFDRRLRLAIARGNEAEARQ